MTPVRITGLPMIASVIACIKRKCDALALSYEALAAAPGIFTLITSIADISSSMNNLKVFAETLAAEFKVVYVYMCVCGDVCGGRLDLG